MAAKREFRVTVARELRAEQQEDGKQFISGYAAVFNSLSEEMWGFREKIMPGAFARTLRERVDCRQLINHDSNLVLGRTTAGTLQLSEDEKGLRFRCEMPKTSYAADLMESIRRGDISQCSFGFITRKQAWIEDDANDVTIREIHDVDLFDTSVVTYPAYPETSVAMRRSELRQFFPDGVPEDIREHRNDYCACQCDSCLLGDCENCDNAECDDPNCDHSETVASRRPVEHRLRTVGGKKLALDKFALVGDPNDISTWALPVHDARAVRESLALYQGIRSRPPAALEGIDLDKAWNALTTAAKKFGVALTDEQARTRAVVLDPKDAMATEQVVMDLMSDLLAAARTFSRNFRKDKTVRGKQLRDLLAESCGIAALLGEFGIEIKPLPVPINHDDISRAARARIAAAR
jgi:HK97 family phage prohead protease